MRTMKFRAWLPHDKEMIYDTSLHSNDPGDVKPWIFMQFTGLLDKNGKEIYEGDIISSPESDVRGFIYFGDNEYAPRTMGWCFQGTKTQGSYPLDNPAKDWKVIGNVHESPELLSENK